MGTGAVSIGIGAWDDGMLQDKTADQVLDGIATRGKEMYKTAAFSVGAAGLKVVGEGFGKAMQAKFPTGKFVQFAKRFTGVSNGPAAADALGAHLLGIVASELQNYGDYQYSLVLGSVADKCDKATTSKAECDRLKKQAKDQMLRRMAIDLVLGAAPLVKAGFSKKKLSQEEKAKFVKAFRERFEKSIAAKPAQRLSFKEALKQHFEKNWSGKNLGDTLKKGRWVDPLPEAAHKDDKIRSGTGPTHVSVQPGHLEGSADASIHPGNPSGSDGLARTVEIAIDTGPKVDCFRWARAGQCKANPGYMLVSCKASCAEQQRQDKTGEPAPDQKDSCWPWAFAGECERNHHFMNLNCASSCADKENMPLDRPTPNKDNNCRYWADKGECEVNPDFMLASCGASCAHAGVVCKVGDRVRARRKDAVDYKQSETGQQCKGEMIHKKESTDTFRSCFEKCSSNHACTAFSYSFKDTRECELYSGTVRIARSHWDDKLCYMKQANTNGFRSAVLQRIQGHEATLDWDDDFEGRLVDISVITKAGVQCKLGSSPTHKTLSKKQGRPSLPRTQLQKLKRRVPKPQKPKLKTQFQKLKRRAPKPQKPACQRGTRPQLHHEGTRSEKWVCVPVATPLKTQFQKPKLRVPKPQKPKLNTQFHKRRAPKPQKPTCQHGALPQLQHAGTRSEKWVCVPVKTPLKTQFQKLKRRAPATFRVTGSGVNVRFSPGLRGGKAGMRNKGYTFEATSEPPRIVVKDGYKWVELKESGGRKVWMVKKYLQRM